MKAFIQMKKKKQAEQAKPDPDAYYIEEADFELPDNEERSDDEEIDAESGDEENELI